MAIKPRSRTVSGLLGSAALVGLGTAVFMALHAPAEKTEGRAAAAAERALPAARPRALTRAIPLEPGGREAESSGLSAVVLLAGETGQWADAALAEIALADPAPAVREEAVHALGQRGGWIAVETLRQALQDPSERVRHEAIRALTEVGEGEAITALGAVADFGDVAMRLDATDALGSLGGPAAARHLARLAHDENETVRQAALEWSREHGP